MDLQTATAQKLANIRRRIQDELDDRSEAPPEMSLPDLQPLRDLHSLAAHQAASAGAVNPRPPGPVNDLVQLVKKALAKLTAWQFRPQREFNHSVLQSLKQLTVSLEEIHRTVQSAYAQMGRENLRIHTQQRRRLELARSEQDQVREQLRRQRWTIEGSITHQTEAFEQFRDTAREQLHQLDRRLAAQARASATRLVGHVGPAGSEASASASPAPAGPGHRVAIDYYRLEQHFRGTEEEILARQSIYLPFFQGRENILDIACGRGEFLQLLQGGGVAATGVDLDADMVARCLEKNLHAVQADVFEYLASIPDGSLGGIFSSQFVEHLEPEQYTQLIVQCGRKLMPGGLLAMETQNPECLAIFSQSFYIDPTHTRPIPPAQLRFLFLEAGLERLSTHLLSPASSSLPLIPPLQLPSADPATLKAFNDTVARFNETFFGCMDYSVIGYRPGTVPTAPAPSPEQE